MPRKPCRRLPRSHHRSENRVKLVDHFRAFLKSTVNLNATRLGDLEDSVKAIKTVIRAADWKPNVREFLEQGSWAHGTIIKPVEGNAFDADLVVLLDPVDGWDAKTYISGLRSIFANHGTYEDKVRRWSHCVTLEYAGERKVDVAPCIVNRLYDGSREVCNFDTNAFEASEPERYTAWMIERNAWTGANGLRKVTRLHKYLRDIKTNYTCPSVLLTTLLGSQITSIDESDKTNFDDVATALRTITARLDEWLQARSHRPEVRNPVLASEVFSDRWTDTTYANFRDKIHLYRSWIDDAYLETDRAESIGKWRRVFGDEFAADVALAKAAGITEDARRQVAMTKIGTVFDGDDAVELFRRFGVRSLPADFDQLPHKTRPRWRPDTASRFPIVVEVSLHSSQGGAKIVTIPTGYGPIQKGQWLRFEARSRDGRTLGGEFDVEWRVTNTDKEAAEKKCLRGDFYASTSANVRWESLLYRGVHTVEAFVVRRRDRALLAQGDAFYVVVE